MEVLLLALLTLFATFVGTITGFGTSSIMLPVLSLFYPLPVALLFVGIIHFFGDLWKVLLFKKKLNWRLILLFGLPGLVTSYFGASLILELPENLLKGILGILLIIFVVIVIIKHKLVLPKKDKWLVAGGAVDGFLAGIVGIGGPLRAAFLSAYDLQKAVHISTSGALGLMVDSIRLTTYVLSGVELYTFLLWGMIIYVPVSFIGAKLGQKTVKHIPQKDFHYVVGFFLLIVAVVLLSGL